MLGLLGTLDLANRSLETNRQGTEVAGHNLANVNNPAYARQRLEIATSLALPSEIGSIGTGAEAVAIRQLRNSLVDRQIETETGVRQSLQAQQDALQFAEASLGQQIDRKASGPEGTTAASGVGGQHGLAEDLSDLFNSFQSLSADPTSQAERQNVVMAGQKIATQFNQVSQRLSNLRGSLNQSVQNDVQSFNDGLKELADLNQRIASAELGAKDTANDLRDLRQQKLASLAQWSNFDISTGAEGSVNLSIGGMNLVTGSQVSDQLEAYDSGNGQILIRSKTSGAAISPTGGSLQGAIEARDGAVANLQKQINALAGNLIAEVNAIHAKGFSLTNSTGENFFTGTDASTIGFNQKLADDPALVQAAAVSDAPGDNQTSLALAQLGQQRLAGLNNATFQESYAGTVTAVGQSLASVNDQLGNQQIVEDMLKRQRDAVSGVSLDEEMTNLMKYQKAFEASARLVVTIDQMLEETVNLKR